MINRIQVKARLNKEEYMHDKFITVKEVSKLVGFNVDWIYKKIAKGEFPKPIKIGRSSR